jgi:uncharacterized membrane protein YdjX (TVP38/TMEM64 family)
LATEPLPPPPSRSKKNLARAFLLLWLVVGIVAVIYLPTLKQWLTNLNDWIRVLGWIGPLVYIIIYILFCIFLIPSMALSLGVGPAFGFWPGLLYTVVASNLGGTVAFLLGRTLLRRRVETWARDKPRLNAIDAAVARNAIPIVALIRMSPFLPFTILNYVLSLTRIPWWKYALGTFCGMLPLNAAFVFIGCEVAEAAKTLSESAKKELQLHELIKQIAGIVVTIVALVVISRIAAKAIKNASAQNQAPS